MTQPLHNPLLKSNNTSVTTTETASRSRSSSFLKAISLHPMHSQTSLSQGTTSLSRTNTNSSERSNSRFGTEELESPSSSSLFHSCHLEDFEIRNAIGYGSSAIVYHAIYKPKNMRVAIKIIDLDLFERNQIDELRRETALMALSKHPNVLAVYGSFVHGSKLYIATPYLSGGSCLDIMKCHFQDGFSDESIIATILKQALEGLVYLHKNNHIHRDVKAGNLLMDDQGTVLLADFGVSSSLTDHHQVRKTFVGTPCWMAPEVMEQSGYDFKADIWSFGITAMELATGHAPFAKFAPMKVLMMTLNQEPPSLDKEVTKYKYSRLFKDMIDHCLQKDPSKRPTAEKLLTAPFFKQFARKKEYLIKSVLTQVPSLDQRSHFKQRNHYNKHQEEEKQEQPWDFEGTSDTKEKESNPKSKHITFLNNNNNNNNNNTDTPEPIKKSRFVIEEQPSQHPHQLTVGEYNTTISSQRSDNDTLHHSIFTLHSTNTSTAESSWQSSMGMGLGISSSLPEVEVKKGRFSVNQQQQSKPEFVTETPHENSSLSHVSSFDNLKGERKSRFEIQHTPPLSSLSIIEAIPISRHSSFKSQHQRSISRDSTKAGRFLIETNSEDGVSVHRDSIPPVPPVPASLAGSPDCRKKGRFELTGGGQPTPSSIETIMETLLKQNESQKSLLDDLMNTNKLNIYHQEISSTLDRLHQLLAHSNREKERLLKENESLKRQVERLRKKQSILKTPPNPL
ncbi:kinase-like protein [Backusella circina FSU 941]|nr:kinase-like protein [Backusella circina FSU 941]